MKINKEKKRDIYYVIIIFFLCFLPRVIGTFRMVLPAYVADEISTISTAAVLNGQDWSYALENVGYYGGGMTMIFTPLFSLIKNPIIVYHIMLIFMCFLQAIVGVISWYIEKDFFGVTDIRIRGMIAIAASYMVTRRANNVTNEHVLILLTWLIIWVLLILDRNRNNNRNKIIVSIKLAVIMAYALTVHERGKVYLLALLCLIVLYAWVYRKSIISILPFGVTYIIGSVIAKMLKNYIIANNWPRKVFSVPNSEVKRYSFELLFHPTNWRAWISCILGQLTTISMVTGGIFIVALVLTVVILKKCILEQKKDNSELKESGSSVLFIVYIYLFAAIGITVLAQSVMWLPGCIKGFEAGYDNGMYDLKILTYIRYFGIYVGPILMATLVFMCEKTKSVMKYWKIIISVAIGMLAYWMTFIWPYLSGNRHAVEAFLPFSFETKWNLVVGNHFYLLGVLFFIGCIGILLILLKLKKYKTVISLVMVLLIYQYGYNTYAFDEPMSKKTYSQEITYKNVFENLEELPDTIYVNDTSDERIYLVYQLLLGDKKIVPNVPENSIKEGILISNSFVENSNLLKEGWKLVEHKNDRENYVFVKGKKLQKRCIQQEMKLVDYQSYYEEIENDSYSRQNGTFNAKISGELTTGTYSVSIEGRALEENLQSMSVLSWGNQIVEPIETKNIEKKSGIVTFEFSIPQNYSGVELMLNSHTGKEFAISKIVLEKKSGEYSVGLDHLKQVHEIKETVNSLNKINKMVYLNNECLEVNFAILEEMIPDIEFGTETELSLYNHVEDTLVLVPLNGQEWMPLLHNYDIVGVYSDYILLAAREKINDVFVENIQHYSQNGYIDLETFRMYEKGEYKTENYEGLRRGIYRIQFPIKQDYSVDVTNLSLQIVSDEGIVPLDLTENAGSIIGQFALGQDISKWHFRVKKEYGNHLEMESAQIMQIEPAIVGDYRIAVQPLLNTLVELQCIGKTTIYSDMPQIDILTSECDNVKIRNLSEFDAADVDEEILIIQNDIDVIFDLVDRYEVVDATESYTLLMNHNLAKEYFQVAGADTFLSYQGALKAEYYEKSNKASDNFYAPYGNYIVNVEVSFLEKSVEGELGEVELWLDNELATTKKVKVEANDLLQEKKVVSFEIGNLSGFDDIHVTSTGKGQVLHASLCSIQKISDTYKPAFDKLILDGLKCEEKAIVAENLKKATISTGILKEKGDSYYIYTYVYKAKNPKTSLYLYNTDMQNIILKTGKRVNIEEDIYQSQIIVNPSEDRNVAEMIFKISSAQDFQLLDIEIEKISDKTELKSR